MQLSYIYIGYVSIFFNMLAFIFLKPSKRRIKTERKFKKRSHWKQNEANSLFETTISKNVMESLQ